MFLAIFICAVTPYNNAFLQATPLGGGHFPLAPFFILVWLTLLIALLNMIFRNRTLLTGKELLVAWILMVLVSGIAYTGLMRTFFINLTAPFHFATVENRWEETLQPFLPQAWYPQNSNAVQMLYDGLPGGRQMAWYEVISQNSLECMDKTACGLERLHSSLLCDDDPYGEYCQQAVASTMNG